MLMHTLSDLVRITGAPRRTVQWWAEMGALCAEPETERSGTGVHRRFDETEAKVAKVLAKIAVLSPSTARLAEIAHGVREILEYDAHDVAEGRDGLEFIHVLWDDMGNLSVLGGGVGSARTVLDWIGSSPIAMRIKLS